MKRVQELARKAKGEKINLDDIEKTGIGHKQALRELKEMVASIDRNPHGGYKYSSTENGTVVWFIGENKKDVHKDFWAEIKKYVSERRGHGIGVSNFHEGHPHKFYGTCETLWVYTSNKRNYLLLAYDYEEVFIPNFAETLPLSKNLLRERVVELKRNTDQYNHKEIDNLRGFIEAKIDQYFGR